MGKINLTVDNVVSGKQISFVAPCSTEDTDGLIINGVDYIICDAKNNNLAGVAHIWEEGAIVSIIVNVETGMAYIQNADTNAYLENTAIFKDRAWILTREQFGDTAPKAGTPGRLFFLKAPKA